MAARLLPRAPSPRNAGHSLVELMIAMTAGAVVLTAAYEAMVHWQHRLRIQQETMGRQQDLRIGLRVLVAELRAAGTGAAPTDGALLRAEREEIEFLANLNGFVTTLTGPASPGQQELTVRDGSGWPKGKRVLICDPGRCAENRLARDGQRSGLSLSSPLGQPFPVSSTVFVSNRVRYYLGQDRGGKPCLMRQVDGGANPLIGDISRFGLAYLDRDGRPTQDSARVARVRMELAVGERQRPIGFEIGLRGR